MSRRRPDFVMRSGYRHFPVDIRNADAVASVVRDASPVTEVVYAALHEQPNLISGWVEQEQISTNRLMFANVLAALRAARSPVEHMSVLQGTKAYGYHVATDAHSRERTSAARGSRELLLGARRPARCRRATDGIRLHDLPSPVHLSAESWVSR